MSVRYSEIMRHAGGYTPAVTPPKKTGSPRVSYIDESGEKQSGTVEETRREDPYWQEMRDTYERMYADSAASNDSAAALAAGRASAAAESQIRALDQETEAANRALYRSYMNSGRVLPQQLAAAGYTGGMSESARLRLETSYGEGVNENERSRRAEENSIRASAEDKRWEAEQKAAERTAAANETRYSRLAALRQQQHEDELSAAQDRAARMAEAGDFSGYLALGYTQSEVDYLTRLWLTQNQKYAALRAAYRPV